MLTDRQSNFELLRIFAMLFIIMHHYSVHGGFVLENEITFNKIFLQMMAFGGKLGVDIFVIISGYFLINEGFKLRKLLKLMAQMWFYSIGLLVLVLLFDVHSPGFKDIVKAILPFGMLSWFAYAYFVLYLIFPFENVLLKNLDRKKYLLMLVLGFILWFAIPTFTKISMQFSILILFGYLYAVGAYIRIYHEKSVFRNALKISALGYVIYLFLSIILDLLALKYDYFIKRAFYFTNDKSVFILIVAIGLLLYFKSLKMKYNKFINLIAATTFGIYLLHDNDFVRKFLWHNIFKNYLYYDSNFLVFHAVFAVISVFIVCGIIDYLRLTFIEKPLFKYLNPKIDNLETKLRAKLDIILERIIQKTV